MNVDSLDLLCLSFSVKMILHRFEKVPSFEII